MTTSAAPTNCPYFKPLTYPYSQEQKMYILVQTFSQNVPFVSNKYLKNPMPWFRSNQLKNHIYVYILGSASLPTRAPLVPGMRMGTHCMISNLVNLFFSKLVKMRLPFEGLKDVLSDKIKYNRDTWTKRQENPVNYSTP